MARTCDFSQKQESCCLQMLKPQLQSNDARASEATGLRRKKAGEQQQPSLQLQLAGSSESLLPGNLLDFLVGSVRGTSTGLADCVIGLSGFPARAAPSRAAPAQPRFPAASGRVFPCFTTHQHRQFLNQFSKRQMEIQPRQPQKRQA